VLLLLAIGFAVANLWLTAERSTIPRHLDGRVAEKERRLEKKAGVDDVWLVSWQSDDEWQVDQQFFHAVEVGDHVAKESWSRRLRVNDRVVDLSWSRDFQGMLWAMPSTVVVVTLVLLAGRFIGGSR
jgi:hypothetical protein